jgi:hypothetical protein
LPDAPESRPPARAPEPEPHFLDNAEAPGGVRALRQALRTNARRLAMLALYGLEAHRFGPGQTLRELLRWLSSARQRRARATAVAEAALAERARLDALLNSAAVGWTLERMGAVERAVLRAAAGELLVLRDAPAGAVIDDCVEIARRYGAEDSPGFVNAILSQFAALPEAAAILARPSAGKVPVDLHVHTSFSDGDMAPEEVVRAAAAAGLAAVAVADHDEVAGIALAAAEGAKLGVEVVPAVELTSYRGESELHVLGLFIDPAHAPLLERLAFFRQARVERARKMCALLAALGAPVGFERVLAIAGPGAVGRPHVAKALVEASHCADLNAAFKRFIGNSGPAWVPKAPFAPEEAVALIHAAGGLAFLAHPGITGRDELVPELVRAGLDGLETRHSMHAAPVAEHYWRWAQRRDLLRTGGSDFHGGFKPDAPIGAPFVPESWLILIRNRWKLLRAPAPEARAAPPAAAPAGGE